MTPSEIIMLITAIFTALAAAAAFITCYLHYLSLKPKISIQKYDNHVNYFYYYDKEKDYCCAALLFNFINSSNVPGSISEISIIYNKKEYDASEKTLNYKFKEDITFETDVETKINIRDLIIHTPIKLEPYSNIEGFIIVPGIPTIKRDTLEVKAKFKVIGKKLPIKIKKLKLEYSK